MRLMNLRTKVMQALSGEAVPMLSIAGNTFTLMDQDNKKIVTKIDPEGNMYVDVHIVDAAFSTSKMYWKEKFSQKEDEQKAPDCFSNDGVKPDPQSNEKQCTFCSECQWNVWGTAIGDAGSGKGKRCRDVWKIAVVVPEFSPTALWQFRIPPASLKNWKTYMGQFSEFSLPTPDGGEREGHVGDVVTRIYFEQGKQGVVNFGAAAMAEPPQVAYLEEVQIKNTALHLIGGAPAQLPPPEEKKQIEAPKPSAQAIDQYTTRSEQVASQIANELATEQAQEEDEEAVLMRKLAAAKAKKREAALHQEAAHVIEEAAKQAVTNITNGSATKPKLPGATMSKPPVTTGAKPSPVVAAKPKGVMDLGPGMRTKMDMMASKANAVDAEIVHETKPTPKPASPAGIPQSNMPDELQNMLNDVMGM